MAGPGLTWEETKSWQPNFSDPHALPGRTSWIDLGVTGPLAKWRTDFLFDYDIFPPSILCANPEWQDKGRAMQVGDDMALAAFIPPIGFGFCMEFGVRIRTIIQEQDKLGFSYETLQGHPERGVSEFYFEEWEGRVRFVIHTLSEPGSWATRVVGPVLTLPYQAWCTRRALKHVQRRFLELNTGHRKETA